MSQLSNIQTNFSAYMAGDGYFRIVAKTGITAVEPGKCHSIEHDWAEFHLYIISLKDGNENIMINLLWNIMGFQKS